MTGKLGTRGLQREPYFKLAAGQRIDATFEYLEAPTHHFKPTGVHVEADLRTGRVDPPVTRDDQFVAGTGAVHRRVWRRRYCGSCRIDSGVNRMRLLVFATGRDLRGQQRRHRD